MNRHGTSFVAEQAVRLVQSMCARLLVHGAVCAVIRRPAVASEVRLESERRTGFELSRHICGAGQKTDAPYLDLEALTAA